MHVRPPARAQGAGTVLSPDGGKTWDTANTNVLLEDGDYSKQLDPNLAHARSDNGDPIISTQLSVGSLCTTYYITPANGATHTAVICWEV